MAHTNVHDLIASWVLVCACVWEGPLSFVASVFTSIFVVSDVSAVFRSRRRFSHLPLSIFIEIFYKLCLRPCAMALWVFVHVFMRPPCVFTNTQIAGCCNIEYMNLMCIDLMNLRRMRPYRNTDSALNSWVVFEISRWIISTLVKHICSQAKRE